MAKSIQSPEVREYIIKSNFGHEDVLGSLYELVRNTVPDAKESIKWGMPVFSKDDTNFCYIKDTKDHVLLGFFSRESLEKIDIKLDGSGKSMCHVTIKSKKDIKRGLLTKALKTLASARSLIIIGSLAHYLLVK